MKKETNRKRVEYPEGLQMALCARYFFQARHKKVPLYKKPKSKRNAGQMVGQYLRMAAISRSYIEKARTAGFRGSIVAEVLRLNP